jgi:hypothetical protein
MTEQPDELNDIDPDGHDEDDTSLLPDDTDDGDVDFGPVADLPEEDE